MTSPPENTALVARDEEILRLRLAGRPTRLVARQFNLTVDEINIITDHALEQISDKLRVRITALELMRLDTLSEVYFEKAVSGDPVACGLAVKLSERRCALVGADFRHQDPVQLSLGISPQPSSVDRIMEALNRIARSHGSLTDGSGNRSGV
jgi:hypothetical protein